MESGKLRRMKKSELNLFKDGRTMTCWNRNYKKCIAVTRLLSSLRYYHSMQKKQEEFTDFMVNTYKQQVFEDYHHLVKIHDGQVLDMNQYFIQEKWGEQCDVKSCEYATRHHRTDNKGNVSENQNESTKMSVAKEIMDSLHVYIYHLHDYGLRVKDKSATTNHEEKDEQKSEYFDKEFYRVSRTILEREKYTKFWDRFGTSSGKFLIKTEAETSKTYLDKLCHHLEHNNVNMECIERLKTFFEDEEFDTDALGMDIDIDPQQSNTAKQVNNQECMKQIVAFIKTAKRMFRFCFHRIRVI